MPRTAVSFAVIRSLALDGSFTFDRDFRDYDIAVYPDS
jgi:predicted nucleic acid-binding protein